jgi:HK97 family phage major capsid protein
MTTIAQRLAVLNATLEENQKVKDFCTLARCLALGEGKPNGAQRALRDMMQTPRNKILLGRAVKGMLENNSNVWNFDRDMRQKAAAAAGTTQDSSWALPLADYQVLANAFLESLRNFGAFDRLLPYMRRCPLRTRIRAATAAASASTVPQASVKPISKLSLTSTQIDEIKVAAILVITEELARHGETAAGTLFSTELANAIAVSTDAEFCSQLTSGATSFASNGVTAEHVRVDLRGMLAAITTGARSALFLLTTSTIAKALCMLHTNTGDAAFPEMSFNGGSIGGIPVVVSDGVPSGTMLLIDASQLAGASDTITLDNTREALLNMDTNPDSPVVASTPQVSLWQVDMVGLRAERTFGVEKLTTTGVCVVTGANYSGDSPGP